MRTTTEVPAAPEPETAPASEPQVTPPAPAARESDNLSGAELAAAFQRARQAKASRPAPAEPPATPQPPTPDLEVTPPPEVAAPPESDESNTAPTPEPPETPAEPGEEAPTISKMKGRIDQLTAKWRSTERELAEARDQLETTQAAAARPAAPAADQFAGDPEVHKLTRSIADLRAEQKWLAEHPQGGEITNAKGDVIYRVSPEQAAESLEKLPDQLDELRTEKAVRVHELARANKQAVKQVEATIAQRFPWANEAKNEEAEMLRAIEARVPELQRVPGWRLLAAYGLEAMKAEQAKTKPAARPAAQPPRVAVPASAAAPRANGSSRKLAEAEAVFEKSGRAEDLKRVLTLRREARGAPA